MKKKILFLINSLAGGGAEKAMIDLLQHLDYARYEVSLCMVFRTGCYMQDVPPQVRLFHLYDHEWNFPHRKSMKFYRRQGSRLLLRLCARWKIRGHYDAIISFLEGDALLFHDLVRDRADRNITWVHCDLPAFHWTRRVFRTDDDERTAYSHMDRIVFCSRLIMESFERFYDVPVPKSYIYNVVDLEQIRRTAGDEMPPHEIPVVTAVGSLSEVKCLDRLIRVARMCRDAGRKVHFRIVGTGALEAPLKQLCKELDVSDMVEFLGFRKPPYPFMKSSDVFISTSRSEAASLVLCEAMAVGTPVVATRTMAAEEFLEDNRYGIVTGHSDEEIYEGLQRMLDDPQLRDHYRKQGLQRAEQFSSVRTMQQFDELLND